MGRFVNVFIFLCLLADVTHPRLTWRCFSFPVDKVAVVDRVVMHLRRVLTDYSSVCIYKDCIYKECIWNPRSYYETSANCFAYFAPTQTLFMSRELWRKAECSTTICIEEYFNRLKGSLKKELKRDQWDETRVPSFFHVISINLKVSSFKRVRPLSS